MLLQCRILIFLSGLIMFSTSCTSAPTKPVSTTTPDIVGEGWADREIFRAGLIAEEQDVLTQLPGASAYHLDVQIADDFTSLQGKEIVRYTNQEDQALDAVYFQLFPNMQGGESIIKQIVVAGSVVQTIYEEEKSTLRVPLANSLQPGQSVVIQVDFQVELPTDAGGNYGLFGYLDDILVLDGFYPAIPVFDQAGWHKGKLPPNSDTTFQDTSFYVVRVTAPAAIKLISSGRQVDIDANGGQQVVTFAAGPARDFYLAGSTGFTVISTTAGETRVNSYAFKSDTQGAQLALNTAVNALNSFNQRLGTYPYTEFDIVSTPMRGATGIEYPGITGINIAVYDLEANYNNLPARIMLETTVAHEVGHQWFYNVVGNDQINEPWLDESLTQYVTGLYFLDQDGKPGWDGYRNSWLNRWERVDNANIPIGMPAVYYQGNEYGAIVYGRGPLFVEALSQKMGSDVFDQFLRDYYNSNRWGIGTAAGFKKSAEQHCQCDLSPLFTEWVDQK
jgi:hypothetical protein